MPCARSSAPSLVALFVVILGGLDLIYSGLYDVGATAPHWAVTRWVLETARTRSIKAHAAGIEAPAGLDDPAKILTGVAHFAAHCAVCHGAPGVPKGDIAKGLNPQPPDLAYASAHYTAPELFWTLQHGIKMTGMPAWNDHSDAELWATVAVLQKLPGMSDEDYGKLVMATMAPGAVQHHHQHWPIRAQTAAGSGSRRLAKSRPSQPISSILPRGPGRVPPSAVAEHASHAAPHGFPRISLSSMPWLVSRRL